MGCGVTFVKYVLFFFNLLVALIGLALIGVGVAAKLKYAPITDLVQGHNINIAPLLSIVLGSIVFVIAFYGCCGAIRESHCMLVMYAVILIVLVIVQVVLAAMLFYNLPGAHDAISTWVNEAFNKHTEESDEAFHSLERTFKCCGTNGPASYVSLTLPTSCCDSSANCNVANAHQTGCIDALVDFIKGTGGALGGLGLGIAAVEVVGVIFSLCLANHARNMERRW